MTETQYRKVLDVVSAVGSESDLDGALKRAVSELHTLFPHEQAFCIQGKVLSVPPFEEMSLVQLDFPDQAKAAYDGYYSRIDPARRMTRPDTKILNLDFNQRAWSRHEFAVDFIHALLHVAVDVCIPLLDPSGRGGFCFGLTRTNTIRRTDSEEEMLLALRPHLFNFCAIFKRLESLPRECYYAAELARDVRLFSKREAQVAGLLCKRMSVPEIATTLLISPRTVERHVENIYSKANVRGRKDLLRRLLSSSSSEIPPT